MSTFGQVGHVLTNHGGPWSQQWVCNTATGSGTSGTYIYRRANTSAIYDIKFVNGQWLDAGSDNPVHFGTSTTDLTSITPTDTDENLYLVYQDSDGNFGFLAHLKNNGYTTASGPTVTSITDDTIFVPSDTVSNTDFTLLKNGSAYANTNISLTGPGPQPPSDARGYAYSLTYNGTAIYSRTIDSKSFHDLYYDDSWTSSPTSSRSTNTNRILNIIGTIPNTANFTVPTVVGQTIGTRTFHDLNRSMRIVLTYPAGSTHTQFKCYFHVSEISGDIKGKFESHTLGVTVFDESSLFTIGAQQTMSHTFTINGSNITISVDDWVYSDQPEGDGYVAPVTTTSNGGGKPDRYPLIMTNLFNRNRSIYSIGMTHKDTWDLFL
jgi:hypothetical protein